MKNFEEIKEKIELKRLDANKQYTKKQEWYFGEIRTDGLTSAMSRYGEAVMLAELTFKIWDELSKVNSASELEYNIRKLKDFVLSYYAPNSTGHISNLSANLANQARCTVLRFFEE